MRFDCIIEIFSNVMKILLINHYFACIWFYIGGPPELFVRRGGGVGGGGIRAVLVKIFPKKCMLSVPPVVINSQQWAKDNVLRLCPPALCAESRCRPPR